MTMPKDSFVVVTAVGRDRPGLIASLSSIVASMEGNIEDLDQVAMKNAIFVMSILINTAKCKMPFEKFKKTLVEKGKELGLKVEVYDADLIGV